MALLLERICVTTVAVCKKQGEIDALLKEGVADTSSPVKSTAMVSLKRSSDPETLAARSKLSEVMEKLSRAPMLNGLSKIALTAADAARPNSLTELERIDLYVSRVFHEALPETLPITSPSMITSSPNTSPSTKPLFLTMSKAVVQFSAILTVPVIFPCISIVLSNVISPSIAQFSPIAVVCLSPEVTAAVVDCILLKIPIGYLVYPIYLMYFNKYFVIIRLKVC